MPAPKPLLIGVVGPCKSGKSMLVSALHQQGIYARHIAQEHSYVKDMWQKITNPDILIYLHVSYEGSISRRQLNWTAAEYSEQLRRLEHARTHADLVIDTTELTKVQVLGLVLRFLLDSNIHPTSFLKTEP